MISTALATLTHPGNFGRHSALAMRTELPEFQVTAEPAPLSIHVERPAPEPMPFTFGTMGAWD